MSAFIAITLAYLLGSISGSLVLGRLRDVDIRQQGSGNAGGTNAFRTQGLVFALGVVFIDIGKGALAVLIPEILQISQPGHILATTCGFVAIVGHCYPIWHKFHGGKGAGTLIGTLLVLAPIYMLPVLVVWLFVILLSGFVGLATLLAVCTLLPVVLMDQNANTALLSFVSASILLIVFTHRENIRRLLKGTENRFEKIRIQNWFKSKSS